MSSTENPAAPRLDWDRLRKGARIALIVQGVLSLLMGLVFLFLPFASIWVLGVVFGAWILTIGVMSIIGWIARDREHRSGWALVSAILSVIAGILVLVLPGTAAVATVYIMAFWAIALGALYAVNSFELRRLGAAGWWAALITGILAVVLGVIMLMNPGAAVLVVVWVIGAYAIVDGITEIVLGVRMRKNRA
ncbi:HdeD family acid-resistance protein [Brevibacterium album]|uniref:HdeD family acid-resistance protein n=1 Tax=Brevibacterium album TaxID=417948 RepID=UPI00042913DC|nr:HdeD family acid-resistance protein [Brevibacterium album]